MQVNEAMSSDVKIASPNQSIRDAAKMMAELDAGVLPVGENDKLVGMITDRDIAVRAVAAGKPPTTPVQMSMTAAYTESRASVALSAPPASIIDTTSPTSITVIASARTRVPKGSPTRCATTSAWWTAATTTESRAVAHASASTGCGGRQRLVPRSTIDATGTATVQSAASALTCIAEEYIA